MGDDVKSIAILGTGDSLRLTDFSQTEVWGVNGVYTVERSVPDKFKDKIKIDKLFMTDFIWSYEGNLNFHIGDLHDFAEKYNCELITLNPMQLGKYRLKAKKYPYKQIHEYFQTEYFTDTIAYMIAYALYTHTYLAENEKGVIRPELEMPLKIELFGVDMGTSWEYLVSKGGIEFWLGIARGMGVEVALPNLSTILAHPRGHRYGTRPKLDLNLYDPYNLLGDKGRGRRAYTGSEKIARIASSMPSEDSYKEAVK